MIIGLCGVRRSGKDTVGAYLVKQHGYERRAFADPLKKSVANLFDIPFSEVDKLKVDPHTAIELTLPTESALHEARKIRMLFFEFLQRYGTEAHRDVPEMGENFWVDLTLPVQGYYVNRNLVVTDVRFANEAARIEQLGGIVVQVKRPGTDNNDPHRSEQLEGIEPHYILYNDRDLDELYTDVEAMLQVFTDPQFSDV